MLYLLVLIFDDIALRLTISLPCLSETPAQITTEYLPCFVVVIVSTHWLDNCYPAQSSIHVCQPQCWLTHYNRFYSYLTTFNFNLFTLDRFGFLRKIFTSTTKLKRSIFNATFRICHFFPMESSPNNLNCQTEKAFKCTFTIHNFWITLKTYFAQSYCTKCL